LAYASLIAYVLILFIRPQEWVSWMLNLNIMVFVAGFAVFATLIGIASNKWRFKNAPQNVLVFWFFVAVLVSNLLCFESPFNKRPTLFAFTNFGKVVFFFFLISINLRTARQVRGLIVAVIIGCLFMSIHGILQIHTGSGFGAGVNSPSALPLNMVYEHTQRIQAFGFFADPNDLALALVVALPFVINVIHRPGSSAPARLLCLGIAGVLGYAIFLTNSRGGWLALAITTMCYLLLNFRMKKIAVVTGILFTVGLMMLAPGRVSSSSMSSHDESARGRMVAWTDGNRMLKSSPIFGVGYERFTDFAEGNRVAHNSFVHCYGELGLFGYFFWLALLFASVKDCYAMGKDLTSDDPERREMGRLARVMLASFIGYIAASVFLSRTYTPLLFLMFGLIAALHAAYERQFGALKGGMIRRDLKYVLLIELASIPFFYLFLRFAL
jgi:O-antigen ligase